MKANDPLRIPVRNPRTGRTDYDFQAASAEDIAGVAARLRGNQPAWAARPLDERTEILLVFADAIETKHEKLLQALATDTGRTTLSKIEIDGVVGMLRRWAGVAPGILQEQAGRSQSLPSVAIETTGIPRGLVGVISPWNFPLLLSFIDTVPALYAGCAALIKPSEVTPRFVEPLRALIADVPGLGDVLDIVLGDGATGAALVEQADMICFTGSVATGRKVAASCAATFIPCSLELGGKDPVIVRHDADIERAATAIVRSATGATGQGCQSVERIYVHEAVHDALVAALIEAAETAKLSYPDAAGGTIGPFIFARQAEIVEAQIDDAVQHGARLHCGGEVLIEGGGRWMLPTVLTGVDNGMRIMREETFGPVIPIVAFADDEEAVRLANDSEFGLSGAVFSADMDAAKSVARRIKGGAISINDAGLTSFVYDATKDSYNFSGLGPSRSGTQAMTRFLRNQSLLINEAPPIPLAAYAEKPADSS